MRHSCSLLVSGSLLEILTPKSLTVLDLLGSRIGCFELKGRSDLSNLPPTLSRILVYEGVQPPQGGRGGDGLLQVEKAELRGPGQMLKVAKKRWKSRSSGLRDTSRNIFPTSEVRATF